MSTPALNLRAAFRAVDSGGAYSPSLAALRRGRHSGVYAIIEDGSREVWYVGESHTGRLYDTITRHFRSWRRDDGHGERRTGGTTYDRRDVLIAYVVTPAAEAQEIQYEEIQRLQPRDNTIEGCSVTGTCDAPF